MFYWKKNGLIFVADQHADWMQSHAMIPTVDKISEDRLRIYLTFCDAKGIGRVGFVEVDAADPSRVLRISDKPALDIGLPGTFDENGVLQTSIVSVPDGRKFLYYAGFELGAKIRYRLLTGLAISEDGGLTFKRVKKTPVLERSDMELHFRGGPFVLFDEARFKMWYVAGSEWQVIDGKSMPVYVVKYVESVDGIHWPEEGRVCIPIQHESEHGFGRPYVVKENGLYRMFYSIRVKHLGYRLGYAESKDNIEWVRKDGEIGLDVSPSGWDSQTICYSAVVLAKGKTYMFYNGNEFGKSGFGYAELVRNE
jgi:sucrose-6-phosphate hydrolase SacC (GH32 family)